MSSATSSRNDHTQGVVISSTLLDLQDHRAEATKAVGKARMKAVLMERDEGAVDATPRNYSLSLVDECAIYIGIFGYRYGDPPPGETKSLTELEYRRAVKNNLSIYIYIMDEEHLIKPRYVETDPSKRARLEELKNELRTKHKVGFFTSAEHLHMLVYEDLLKHSISVRNRSESPDPMAIPAPPEPYFAHRYGLSRSFFGRAGELNDIDTWMTTKDTTLIIRSLGGVGKTSLAWHWVMERPDRIRPKLKGVLWWSFYDPESTLSSFINHALAYVSGASLSQVEDMEASERERALLGYLNRDRYLMVLDGLERILNAFHIMTASQIADEEIEQSLRVADRRVRAFADERDGRFVRDLASVKSSKILITTRLIPSDLEVAGTNKTIPGIREYPLTGLAPKDALFFIHSLGVFGTESAIRFFLKSFEYHPLVIGLIAGLVNKNHPAHDFDQWLRSEGQRFRLHEANLVQRRTDILHYALQGLGTEEYRLLSFIAAFGDRVDFTTLLALYQLLAPTEESRDARVRHIESRDHALLRMLQELEERGLIQRDYERDQYDMHPVVRTYTFQRLQAADRKQVFSGMVAYFEQIGIQPKAIVRERSELRDIILFYRALVGCGQLNKAATFFRSHLWDHLYYELADYYTIIDLLQPLFPNGLEAPPALSLPKQQSQQLEQMASVLSLTGDIEHARKLRELKLSVDIQRRDLNELVVGLANFVNIYEEENRLALGSRIAALAGKVAQAAGNAYCLAICQLRYLQLYVDMSMKEHAQRSFHAFTEYVVLTRKSLPSHAERVLEIHAELELSRLDLQSGADPSPRLARAADLALQQHYLLGYVTALWLQAECALSIHHNHKLAENLWEEANAIAFKSQLSVTGYYTNLARARVIEKEYDKARELINTACANKEPSLGIAHVYSAIGDRESAERYGLLAYQAAWGEGRPYAKNWELVQAEHILDSVGVPVPRLVPFNLSIAQPVPFEFEILQLVGIYGVDKGMPETPLVS